MEIPEWFAVTLFTTMSLRQKNRYLINKRGKKWIVEVF